MKMHDTGDNAELTGTSITFESVIVCVYFMEVF